MVIGIWSFRDKITGMYLHYFYWQYIVAPYFLLRFFATLHAMLLQLFSVRVMFTTLFAHWHRDKLALTQGSAGDMLRALMLNAISRAVGFVVRSSILFVWLGIEIIFVLAAGAAVLLFLIAPLAALIAIIAGVRLLASGG